MMQYVYQYNNAEERKQIIQSNNDKYLFKEEIITEGNFLTFLDTPYEIPIRTVYTEVPAQYLVENEQRLSDLEIAIAAILGGAV